MDINLIGGNRVVILFELPLRRDSVFPIVDQTTFCQAIGKETEVVDKTSGKV